MKFERYDNQPGSGCRQDYHSIEDTMYRFVTLKDILDDNESFINPKKDYMDVLLKLIESFTFTLTGRRIRVIPLLPKWDLWSKEIPAILDLFMRMTQERDDWGLAYEYHTIAVKNKNVCVNSAGIVQILNKAVLFDLELRLPQIVCQNKGFKIRTRNRRITDLPDDMYKMPEPGQDGRSSEWGTPYTIEEIKKLLELYCNDGFEKLKAYDMDNNYWIEEADTLLGDLSILFLNRNKEKIFIKLGEIGNGTVYLKAIPAFLDERL
ncbi:MAG: hypothetical protein ACYCX2_00390 [Christensenellales bacterium]